MSKKSHSNFSEENNFRYILNVELNHWVLQSIRSTRNSLWHKYSCKHVFLSNILKCLIYDSPRDNLILHLKLDPSVLLWVQIYFNIVCLTCVIVYVEWLQGTFSPCARRHSSTEVVWKSLCIHNTTWKSNFLGKTFN